MMVFVLLTFFFFTNLYGKFLLEEQLPLESELVYLLLVNQLHLIFRKVKVVFKVTFIFHMLALLCLLLLFI